MKPLVKITENIVDKSVSRLGAIQTHIFLNWKNIAGQYADVTFPDKIKFDKNKNSDGQIIIKVQNGFGPEIQHAIPFFLNQINSRFGFKAIMKVKIVQTDLGYIQELLGHSSSKTTEIYTHVSTKSIQQIKSPFDDL